MMLYCSGTKVGIMHGLKDIFWAACISDDIYFSKMFFHWIYQFI